MNLIRISYVSVIVGLFMGVQRLFKELTYQR